tara:strand:- start:30 stop:443 length:414 start_codon:yes stop_codon:yes gene_type:complete
MRFLKKSNIIFRICFLIIFLLLVFIFFFPDSKNLKYIQNKCIEYIGEINPKNYFTNKKNTKKIRYFVQLGIFAKHNEVDKIEARINILGLKPNIENYLFNGKLTKKITLGPYNSYKNFEKVLKTLDDNNIQYHIINE